MHPTAFKPGDEVRFVQSYAIRYSLTHYRGATGGVISSKAHGYPDELAKWVYTLEGQTYGVKHVDLEVMEGPW